MVRDVNLLGHLPPFIQEYREIREIMQSEDPEFQLGADESERIKNNQFIQSCDLQGIARFEKLMGIVSSVDDTLESRISRAITRWNDNVPYTWNTLLNKLNVLCGSPDAYSVNRDLAKSILDVTTHLDLYGQVEELDYFLSYMMPATFVVQSKNELFINLDASARFGAGIVTCEAFELSDAFKKTMTVDGVASIGSGIVEGQLIDLNDAYKKNVQVGGSASFGSGIVGSISVEITDCFNEKIDVSGQSVMTAGVSATQIISTK